MLDTRGGERGINKYLSTEQESCCTGPAVPRPWDLGTLWAKGGFLGARKEQAGSQPCRSQLRLLFAAPHGTSATPEHRPSRSRACEAYTTQMPDSPRQTHKLPTEHALVSSQRPAVTSAPADFSDMSCLLYVFYIRSWVLCPWHRISCANPYQLY